MLYFVHHDCEIPPHLDPRALDEIKVSAGPDGDSGRIIGPHTALGPQPAVRYDADSQDWHHDGNGTWIGAPKGTVDPYSLSKVTHYGGYTLEDDIGRSWLVPIARSDAQRETLPRRWTRRNGSLSGTWANPEFAELFERAGAVHSWLRAGGVMLEEERAALAMDALAVNYRLTDLELAMLDERNENPFTTQFVNAICYSLIDEPFRVASKKNGA